MYTVVHTSLRRSSSGSWLRQYAGNSFSAFARVGIWLRTRVGIKRTVALILKLDFSDNSRAGTRIGTRALGAVCSHRGKCHS